MDDLGLAPSAEDLLELGRREARPPALGVRIGRPPLGDAWSANYTACQVCGSDSDPHHGLGICYRCYMIRFNERRHAEHVAERKRLGPVPPPTRDALGRFITPPAD